MQVYAEYIDTFKIKKLSQNLLLRQLYHYNFSMYNTSNSLPLFLRNS